MCSIRVAVAMLLLGASVQAASQDVRAYQARVDSLDVAWRAAHATTLAHLEAQKRMYASSDTVHVGPLTLLASPGRGELARLAGAAVLDRLSSSYGSSLDLVRSRWFAVRDVRPTDVDGVDSGYVLVAEITSTGYEAFRQVVVNDPSIVTTALRNAVLRSLARGIDPSLATWLGGELPPDTASQTAWAAARASLLSSGAAAARRCYDGALAQCRLTLRLVESGDPVLELYDAVDRRRLVASTERAWQRRSMPPGTGSCISGVDSACVRVLRVLDLPHPVSAAHRVQFVQVAMAIGRAGAMERLIVTPGSVEQRIAAAARVPTDSVASAWVQHLRNGHKPSDDMSPLIAGVSLGWSLLFGVMAMRSSRWR